MQTRGASAMTMARTIVCYPAAFAVYFVCIGLLCPISGVTERAEGPPGGKWRPPPMTTVMRLSIRFGSYTSRTHPAASITRNAHTVAIKWAEGEVGKIVNISCEVTPETSNITWLFKGEPVTIGDRIKVDAKESLLSKDADGTELMKKTSIITVANATRHDAGNYTCVAQNGDTPKIASAYLDLYFPPKWIINTNRYDVVVSPEAGVNVSCVFEAYNVSVVRWRQQGYEDKPATAYPDGVKRIKSTFHIPVHRPEDNGTYICEIQDRNKTAQGKVEVFVKAPPKVILNATGIGTTQIYLKWDVFAYNSDIKAYHLYYRENEDKKEFQQYTFERISPKNTSFVMRHGLKKATKYRLKLEIQTEFGSSKEGAIVDTATLDFEPVFVPNISINGFSATSVTIGWSPPNEKVAPFIHYYILEAKKKDEDVSRRAYHSRDGRNLPYMFDNLAPHSTYIFKVCACSDYTGQCGNWSDKMEAATLDGNPTKPTTVKAYCTRTFMNLTWGPPQRPNAEIKGYTMELTGNANFTDRYGNAKQVTWGPLSKFTTNDTRIVRFDDLQPNMHYTVRLSAMTRTRRRGDEETVSCNTQPAPPDHPPRPRWRKIIQDDRYMFKMYLPRISERNGPLCCYRVYMVRLLPNTDWNTLPPPKDIMVMTHREAHGQSAMLGAYITDIFSNDNFPLDSELVMGDEKSQYNDSESTLKKGICNRCFMPKKYEPITTTSTTTTSTSTSTTTEEYDEEGAEGITSAPETTESRNRRSYEKNFTSNPILADRAPGANGVKNLSVCDGPLDTSANYTLFVELITQIPNEPAMYSDYVNALMPAATPPAPQPTSTLEIALQATCAVAALVLLLMILFCIRQTRKSRKMPPHAHVEMNSLQAAFRKMFHVRSTHTPMVPPDMAPIPKDELAAAYAERQADSDYGFQKEFEMLPECFPDRTTHASETRENQPKNRYPDIKAYDQTRVKLSQIDGITGSDYINANYVMGYQDRKQFICAQGPTDTTVNDFWRMIWEHGLELIVMLTNLEEYSKVKCSKYWPDEVRGSRAFGGLTVHHVTEKRYSDYIVRELKITKQPLNSEGQPIIENNGIAKRNGDCKEASEGSVPTSPRELKEPESRIVKQYHFLMWKDFAAPEHAYSILKFIKRVNEAWSGILNRACVVHCSAGVGRTGTLVALDCLLDQLRDVGHAAVFNTVAELRRSRNFLVQSLKQYVFVYRALVEYAHYGDTEIPANKLKSAIDRLRNTPPQAANCLMELEFEKILNSPIPEPIKSCAAGAAEELRPKNRSLDILPYDRNRVILAPIPGRDYSTYINASFIEAYDNSEGFIITQDPMPSTIMDFWRMVSEHNVTTIVMLSELGEGKCPRYWDDGTAQYEHISVQYEESESCPYYTRRQFRVVNNKSGCTSCVRHLQYQGWPTAPGHVPEVTRGLGELCDAAELQDPRAMLVHCHLGTERSALFVALCILICQLRTERRVDVCCVARKVRSQRLKTINTFLQYEFLHRAILNYAELHNLLEDS